ncbi:MAG TPA: glycosyltransferase family 2 protein [Terriglobales bacterium]|nr:glycosyltransferase family 2 protein [Terriglobales bacterium]
MSRPPELSAVVPCFNEQEVIVETHRRLTAVLREAARDYELVFVNDGSRDTTLPRLRQIHILDPHVRVVSLSRNFGHQLAVSAGLRHAEGEAVVVIDADLQDPPEVIPAMLEKWRAGCDVVYGVRRSRAGESWFKLLTAKWFYRLLNRIADTQIPADTGDFRLLSRRALDALLQMGETHRLLRGMSSWIGFSQYGLAYDRGPRFAGATKYPLSKMLKLALDGVLSFSTLPLRLASFLGVATAFAGGLGLMGAFFLHAFAAVSPSGWILLLLAMLLLGGMQLLGLGILGEYVGRIYTEARRRPLYVVEEVLERRVQECEPQRAGGASA